MKVSFFPKSKIGKWTLACFITEIVLMIIFYSIIAIFDTKGGETFFSNPELAIPLILAWLSGAMAFGFGCVATVKEKPKSILIFLVILITLLTTLFGILEIAIPH